MTRPLEGRVALVTGASRGLGAAAAVALARLGADLVITARTVGGLEETDDAVRAVGGTATLVPLDLRSGETVDTLGPSIATRFGRLDVLVANAAVLGPLTPAGHILPADWAEVMEINLAAIWRLIRTTAPLLLAAEAGRAVFVTDARARAPRAYWGLYGASKAGMEYLALSWADETRNTNLRVNLFDPGPMASKLRLRAMPAEDRSLLPRPEDAAPALAALCLPEEIRHGALIKRQPPSPGG
ncbi:MAG TPA: SDR family NAD(P)-dependent oxidoreductase [Acetobacteraceae bacterium]|nr:SDR family NAD(P)-dependent oxidoreductase [Acetobacteraceae bacterium]